MSNTPESRLESFLENCKIPLSQNDWTAFHNELTRQKLEYFFESWRARKQKWFKWLSNPGLDEKRIKESLLLASYQNQYFRCKAEY